MHGTMCPNNSDTNYRNKSIENSSALHKDYELQCYFCPFCRPIIFGSASDQVNMTDHIRIRLSCERSERMSSKRAETITHVRVWCHFMARRLLCKQRETTQGKRLCAT